MKIKTLSLIIWITSLILLMGILFLFFFFWFAGFDAFPLIGIASAAVIPIVLLGMGFAYVLSAADKEMKSHENQILFQSQFDTTTELPNRKFFFDYINNLLLDKESAESFALAAIAIDRFPQFNHALGYHISDRLLRHVATRLKESLPRAQLIARFASNIFIVLLPKATPQEAHEIANEIFALFANPFSVYTVSVDVDALIGISFFPNDGHEATDLCQKADLALYQARYASERYQCYNKAFDPQQLNKLSLMSELRDGLAQNEFEIVYQPKVDLLTGNTHQVEGLIRWQHPTKGQIALSQFMPLAEKTGHIKKLTDWLLRNAFQQCKQWQDENKRFKMSVNLSIQDILDKKLPEFVNSLLLNYQLNPENIMFEITESAFMHDEENAIKAIKKISDIGIFFSIDDYGTGYSSLSYLKKLPIKEIKIDKTFTEEINSSEKVKRIVESTIQLGHSINMQVVAEGIVDKYTLNTLREFECDLGQGFLFSEPLSLSALEEWVKKPYSL